jgi:mannose/fructose/N-acetylgalactosamine-specific phosphotransferase system component IIC
MTAWNLVVLPALSAWVALLECDSVLVGQWTLSRPLLLGPLMGFLCGDIRMGLAAGALCELFSFDRAPVGSAIPFNAPVAAGCVVLLCAGPHAVPIPLAFPAGLIAGYGHRRAEYAVRLWRARLTRDAAESLEARGEVDWVRIHLLSVGAHALTTAAFVYAAAAIAGPALSAAWDVLPDLFRRGLQNALDAAPFIGLAALMHVFFRKA